MELKEDGTNGKRRAGLDDQRSKVSNRNEPREDKGSITDTVMVEQSKWHEVQRV